ncbi:MAG: hypothetical protein ABIH28_01110 [archaeon]
MDILTLISGLGSLIREYSIPLILITSLIFGEEIILILSFLSANGYFPLWMVFVFCFAGRIASDFFFFLMGKLKFKKFLSRYQKNIIYESVEKIFSKLNRKSIFITLLYTKLLIGIRAAMMFYIGHKRLSIKEILISDIAAVFVWMAILVPIGWFAGKSFKRILSAFDNLQLALLFLFGLVLMLVLINNYLQRRVRSRNAQLLP